MVGLAQNFFHFLEAGVTVAVGLRGVTPPYVAVAPTMLKGSAEMNCVSLLVTTLLAVPRMASERELPRCATRPFTSVSE